MHARTDYVQDMCWVLCL